MITPEEFNELPLSQKAACIYEYGHYLLCRKGDHHICCLYSLWCYYAELLYHKDTNDVIDIWAHAKTAPLDAYLEELTIEGLL